MPDDWNRRVPPDDRDRRMPPRDWDRRVPPDDRDHRMPPHNRGHRQRRSRNGVSNHVLLAVSGIALVAVVAGLGIAIKTHSLSGSGTDTSAPSGNAIASTSSRGTLKPAPAGSTGKASSSPEPTELTTGLPTSWHLVFDPKFAGNRLDTSVFATCYPWATNGSGCSNYGNVKDKEYEWYMASQDQVSNGMLHLVAEPEAASGLDKFGNSKEYQCRSGIVTTYPGFRFEYGYVQVVAKIPFGTGLWPAIWLAASNQQWPPEIDILEHWHYQAQGKVYLHTKASVRQGGAQNMPHLSEGYHAFGLKWTQGRVIWYYDGQAIYTASIDVPSQSMYLILNVADDANTAGSCSGSMNVKSIKVWQP